MILTKEQIDDMRTSLGKGAQPFTKDAIDSLCGLALKALQPEAKALALLRELNDALVIPGWLQPRVDAVLDKAEDNARS